MQCKTGSERKKGQEICDSQFKKCMEDKCRYQISCFTSTKVQILTVLRRVAAGSKDRIARGAWGRPI